MKSMYVRRVGVMGAALMLTGCMGGAPVVITDAEPEGPPQPRACVPVQDGDAMIGTWYSSTKPQGVSGDLQALTVLRADGTMDYETQLKIGRKIRPALRESGCWHLENAVYTLYTTVSNGEIVDADDPIYVSRYRVEKIESTQLRLRELKPRGQAVTARRMPSGYRLPY